MSNDVSGWMRNNPWEPWCRVIMRATLPGDALSGMKSIKLDAIKRGCLPSCVALPIGEVPAPGVQRAFDEVFEEGGYE